MITIIPWGCQRYFFIHLQFRLLRAAATAWLCRRS